MTELASRGLAPAKLVGLRLKALAGCEAVSPRLVLVRRRGTGRLVGLRLKALAGRETVNLWPVPVGLAYLGLVLVHLKGLRLVRARGAAPPGPVLMGLRPPGLVLARPGLGRPLRPGLLLSPVLRAGAGGASRS